MIIGGWSDEKQTDLGPVAPQTCPRCHNDIELHYVTTTKWFRVYCIPLCPSPTKHFLCCGMCGHRTRLDRLQAPHALAMVWMTSDFLEQRVSPEDYAAAVEDFYAATALPYRSSTDTRAGS